MPLIVNDSKDLINYIHIPKTGGSSIENMISKHYVYSFFHTAYEHGRVSPQHFDRKLFEEVNFHLLPLKNFTIVRNPLERIISEYKYRKKHNGSVKLLLDFDTFISYALTEYEKNPYILDNHIKPQSEFLLPDTKIFKLEDGLQNVIEWLRDEASLKRLDSNVTNKNSSGKEKIYMSMATFNKLLTFYENDFKQFDYERHYTSSFEVLDNKVNGFGLKLYLYKLYIKLRNNKKSGFIT